MEKRKWYDIDASDAIKILKSNHNGLSEAEANARLKRFGKNEIRDAKGISAVSILLRQFKSYFILILLVATLMSFFLGEMIEAFIIFVLVIFTALLGFVQEYRADQAMRALKKLFVSKAHVIRNGITKEIDTKNLVAGDIILLQTGDRIPADARLIEVFDLKTDESTLTGESTPVTKQDAVINKATLAERKNMVFMGTIVVRGRAKAIVISTGTNTELGNIAEMITETEADTPLQVKLTQFTKWLGLFILVVAILLFFVGVLRGEPYFNMLFVATTLAVAAVPEVLPTLITTTLAFGVRQMAKNNAIVRKLSAVETLGAVTVICADKTGTITTNEMTVKKIHVGKKTIEVGGVGFNPEGEFSLDGKTIDAKKHPNLELLLKISALCNDAQLTKDLGWRIVGDPTEGALIVLSAKGNILQSDLNRDYPRIAELPFSSERKRMTTVHKSKGGMFAYTKGAPESVLEVCKIPQKEKNQVLDEAKNMAGEGLRVLAVAYKKLSKQTFSVDVVEKDLVFVGLVGMYDPPRPEVRESIQICRQAGIKVAMLTGDHKLTATTVAKEVGLIDDEGKVVTGEELDKLSDREFENIVEDVTVYARVTPEHKLKIVKMLKKKGHVVAVTGDGVNDAPALKFSDIGVAMGIKGTDVAKEASNLVLTDDNFATIVKAVEEGRGIYDNIRKYMRYLLTLNLSEIFFVAIIKFAGLPLPLLPIQILWLNLITDGPPALALSMDPKDPDIMKRKPRNPKQGILHGMKIFLMVAGFLALVTEMIAFLWSLDKGGGIEKARTMAFTTGIMFQLFFVFNCRSEKKSVYEVGFTSNKYLLPTVFISFLLQLIVVYSSTFQPVFGTTSLNLMEWSIVFLLASSGLLVSPRIFMR